MDLAIEVGIVLIKALLVLSAVLGFASLTTWVERKASALIQDRQGANRASILGFDLAGLLNTLVADPVKALFKEDFVPKGTSQFMHSLGPFLAVFPVLVSFAIVPFGPPLQFEAREVTLQLVDLNVGILFVFAFGSLAVYGVVLAAWVSNNKFSLFGGLRATAQMISYEITMGLSIVGLLMIYQTLDLNEIVSQQNEMLWGVLPRWGLFLNPLGFLLFFVSMMAETKRAPFDMPESESEIVAGYMTEYSGMKFLLFWLGEFAEIVVASGIIVVLFFGGWHLPYYDITQMPQDQYGIIPALVGAAVFAVKTAFFCVLQVVIRWSLPRFRYDQLMHLCWKLMLPLALVNLVATAVIVLW